MGKGKCNNRDLYIKRFEEGWFTWKIRCWLNKIEHLDKLTIQRTCCFDPNDIESRIDNYFSLFNQKFINHWHHVHGSSFSSENDNCKTV